MFLLAASRPVRRCGAVSLGHGKTRWTVWAPNAQSVDLLLNPNGPGSLQLQMRRDDREYFVLERDNMPDRTEYLYALSTADRPLPDPCSLWQPGGPEGPSAVFDPGRFGWTDDAWRGVARGSLVFYELHVGTFTPEGTFDAVIPRLRDLKDLGITAIELLPINQFPGSRNWGYDGVNLYAAQNSYGGPAGLQRLINAAHEHGLAVILDVVYNHFGPESNYVGQFGPYFNDNYKTPWGPAVNYDGPGSDAVRDFVLDNARMWLTEFHADGLRLDAVHAIFDLGARHILRAIKEVADEVARDTGKPRHVIGESDLNDPRIVLDPERGGHGLDAHWADDFHHAAHAFLTGETRGYYSDFGSIAHLTQSLNAPYVYQWSHSKHRWRKHGAPLPPNTPGDRFVVCIQNHDQVGNRARGERIDYLFESSAKRRLSACLLLLSPYLPLIFMGEEYGERNPFPFFCSFRGEDLIRAVREGRKAEFKDFLGDAGEIPLPDAQATFQSAKLTWSWPDGSEHAGLRNLYRDLLAARKTWPALQDFTHRHAALFPDAEKGPILQLVRGSSTPGEDNAITAFFNLADRPADCPPAPQGMPMLLSSEAKHYGGTSPSADAPLLPFECRVFGRRALVNSTG